MGGNHLDMVGCGILFKKDIIEQEHQVDHRPTDGGGMPVGGEDQGRILKAFGSSIKVLVIVGVQQEVGRVAKGQTRQDNEKECVGRIGAAIAG